MATFLDSAVTILGIILDFFKIIVKGPGQK